MTSELSAKLIASARRVIDSGDELAAKRIYLEMADASETGDVDDEFSDVMCELAPLALGDL